MYPNNLENMSNLHTRHDRPTSLCVEEQIFGYDFGEKLHQWDHVYLLIAILE